MVNTIYTAITFAPVQGFIEKSRKLRDLYGSSFLLSYLAEAICKAARRHHGVPEVNPPADDPVISPALINVTQGIPNQIIIRGNYETKEAQAAAIAALKAAFAEAWAAVIETCRLWIEDNVKTCGGYYWRRNWKDWKHHAWEFFAGQGKTITEAREAVNDAKRSRNWTAVNWVGESSTLSGADAVAYPGLGNNHPQYSNYQQQKLEIETFYKQLSLKLGEAFAETAKLDAEKKAEYGAAFVDPDEELSIPELVKRLVTHQAIAAKIVVRLKEQIDPSRPHRLNQLVEELNPKKFTDLNRLKNKQRHPNEPPEEKYWTGWFQGDGDRMSELMKTFAENPETEPNRLKEFSQAMMQWGEKIFNPNLGEENFKPNLKDYPRTIYAGGDDFLGIFYRLPTQAKTLPNQEFIALIGQDCLDWFYQFPALWKQHQQPVTVSVGFVWAAPNVPQRDVLQHCRLAEKSAKDSGKDRLALRILFNSGNWLEWVCPWQYLEKVLEGYRDRDGGKNWGHIYEDVSVLKSRHAFKGNQSDIAIALFGIYFVGRDRCLNLRNEEVLWNHKDAENRTISGILGEKANCENPTKALNEWIINLAQVGFHLCRKQQHN